MLPAVFQSWEGCCPGTVPPPITARAPTYGIWNCSNSTLCWTIKQKTCIRNRVTGILDSTEQCGLLARQQWTNSGCSKPIPFPKQFSYEGQKPGSEVNVLSTSVWEINDWNKVAGYLCMNRSNTQKNKEGWVLRPPTQEEEEWEHCRPGRH